MDRDARGGLGSLGLRGFVSHIPRIAVTLRLDLIAETNELQESGRNRGKILIGF